MKTIYKFYKKACPPCEAFQPIWEELKEQFKSKDIKWVEVDVETERGREFAIERGVRSVPTFISSDGFRHTGGADKATFISKILKNEAGGHWLS